MGEKIGVFLKRLKIQEQEKAFLDAFGLPILKFEQRLNERLQSWSKNLEIIKPPKYQNINIPNDRQIRARPEVKGSNTFNK